MTFDATAVLNGLFTRSAIADVPITTTQPRCGPVGPEYLPMDWRAEWEERAAINEYDYGMTRQRAEAAALVEIDRLMAEAGVVPLRQAG